VKGRRQWECVRNKLRLRRTECRKDAACTNAIDQQLAQTGSSYEEFSSLNQNEDSALNQNGDSSSNQNSDSPSSQIDEEGTSSSSVNVITSTPVTRVALASVYGVSVALLLLALALVA
jgi:hypothetical protein